MLLNVEKYEHMRGPNMDTGVKVVPRFILLAHPIILGMYLCDVET